MRQEGSATRRSPPVGGTGSPSPLVKHAADDALADATRTSESDDVSSLGYQHGARRSGGGGTSLSGLLYAGVALYRASHLVGPCSGALEILDPPPGCGPMSFGTERLTPVPPEVDREDVAAIPPSSLSSSVDWIYGANGHSARKARSEWMLLVITSPSIARARASHALRHSCEYRRAGGIWRVGRCTRA